MPIQRTGAQQVRTPVRGDDVPAIARKVGGKQLEDLDKLKQIDAGQLDQFVAQAQAMLQRGVLRGPQSAAPALTQAAPPGSSDPVSAGSSKVQKLVDGALEGIASLLEKGFVTEADISALGTAQRKMAAALDLADSPLIQMLPRDVVLSLQDNLFEPLKALLSAADADTSALLIGVSQRDRDALQEKLGGLDAAGSSRRLTLGSRLRLDLFKPLDEAALSLDPRERASVGDFVAIGRSGGAADMGVVTGKDDDGLRVEVLTGDGGLGLKKMSYEDYDRRNPIKLGATFQHNGESVFVHGIGDDGNVRARGFSADGRAGAELDGERLAAIASQLRGSNAATAATTQAASPAAGAGPTPTESVVAAGGAEQLTPAVVKGRTAEGGLFTSRGPNERDHGVKYKDYNEDAAVLGVASGGPGKPETFFAGAFDQAGGMGSNGQTGAASQAAAVAFERAAQRVAQGGDPQMELLAGHQEAVAAVAELNVGLSRPMMTTEAAGVIKAGKAHIIACGDAQVLLMSKDGRVKDKTVPHNAHEEAYRASGEVNGIGLKWANGITRSVGGDDPAFQQADYFEWPVEKGDYLLFLSDGVTDANLAAQKQAVADGTPWTRMNGDVTEEQLGEVLRGAQNAEAATAAVADYAMQQVKSGAGKADNTTAVVVQVS